MMGVKSLGGDIYQKALDRDQEFIPIVWATGIIKLGGFFFLLILLKKWASKKFGKWVAIICMIAGIFMILYGVMNFITISLAGLNILALELIHSIDWKTGQTVEKVDGLFPFMK